MARTAAQEIEVPWPIDLPVITATPGTGDNRLTVTVRVDNHGNGPGKVSWDDETPDTAHTGDPAPANDITHTYAAAGTYEICFTDDDRPALKQCATVTVTAPAEPMEIDVIRDDADATGMSILVTVDNKGEGAVELWFAWDDDTMDPDNPPAKDGDNAGDGTTTTGHKYTTAGTYTVRAIDRDYGTTRSVSIRR